LAPRDGEEGGSFFTTILGLPLLRKDSGDFFLPALGGVVFSMTCPSVGPFALLDLSTDVLVATGANGAYDRGLGCRSKTDIGAGLGAATAVDMTVRLASFEAQQILSLSSNKVCRQEKPRHFPQLVCEIAACFSCITEALSSTGG